MLINICGYLKTMRHSALSHVSCVGEEGEHFSYCKNMNKSYNLNVNLGQISLYSRHLQYKVHMILKYKRNPSHLLYLQR